MSDKDGLFVDDISSDEMENLPLTPDGLPGVKEEPKEAEPDAAEPDKEAILDGLLDDGAVGTERDGSSDGRHQGASAAFDDLDEPEGDSSLDETVRLSPVPASTDNPSGPSNASADAGDAADNPDTKDIAFLDDAADDSFTDKEDADIPDGVPDEPSGEDGPAEDDPYPDGDIPFMPDDLGSAAPAVSFTRDDPSGAADVPASASDGGFGDVEGGLAAYIAAAEAFCSDDDGSIEVDAHALLALASACLAEAQSARQEADGRLAELSGRVSGLEAREPVINVSPTIRIDSVDLGAATVRASSVDVKADNATLPAVPAGMPGKEPAEPDLLAGDDELDEDGGGHRGLYAVIGVIIGVALLIVMIFALNAFSGGLTGLPL